MFIADYTQLAMYDMSELNRTTITFTNQENVVIATTDIWVKDSDAPNLVKIANELSWRLMLLHKLASDVNISTQAIEQLYDAWTKQPRPVLIPFPDKHKE
jgi:hypothetical protein